MCEHPTLVPIPEWALENFKAGHPEYGVNEEGRQCFRIDSCIVAALEAVWAAGFKTLGCCCGHGQGYGVISLDLGMFDRPDWKKLMGDHHCSLCGKPHAAPPPEGA